MINSKDKHSDPSVRIPVGDVDTSGMCRRVVKQSLFLWWALGSFAAGAFVPYLVVNDKSAFDAVGTALVLAISGVVAGIAFGPRSFGVWASIALASVLSFYELTRFHSDNIAMRTNAMPRAEYVLCLFLPVCMFPLCRYFLRELPELLDSAIVTVADGLSSVIGWGFLQKRVVPEADGLRAKYVIKESPSNEDRVLNWAVTLAAILNGQPMPVEQFLVLGKARGVKAEDVAISLGHLHERGQLRRVYLVRDSADVPVGEVTSLQEDWPLEITKQARRVTLAYRLPNAETTSEAAQ